MAAGSAGSRPIARSDAANRGLFFVMAGLVPAIHVFLARDREDVDARDKPGHDVFATSRDLTAVS